MREAETREVEVHIILTPPDVVEELGKHRVELIKSVTLDFVPYPGLYLWLTPDLPMQDVSRWSPLLKATGKMNTDYWQVDKVFYHVELKQFRLYCYPGLETREQFVALQELLTSCYGFHVHKL